MKSALPVASPPPRPLMIFDGECNFCALWIRRWQHATRDQVDYLPFQGPTLPARFPELRREQLEAAVQLIETDGFVYSGAEAAFRALAHNPHEQFLLDWYVHSTGFARATERAYRFVASHRRLFSAITRLLWGPHVEPPTHFLVRWVFLRSLALIYLIAFVSLWTQILGLVGSNGILPAKLTMEAARKALDEESQTNRAPKSGLARYHLMPTLCWISASNSFLRFQCAAGTVLAILLLIGFAPAPCLFLLWLIYLSLCTVCREFLGFQWDILLLEIGFLAVFFAPLQLLPRLRSTAPPSRLVLWLLRLLLFKLMFQSGCVKLLSGDTTWHNLTALTFHYETQPLPTWLGWYAHQLPASAQKVSTVIMFVIELAVPFLIFTPRRPRQFACLCFVTLQVLILLSGNYCFFNLLTIALCILMLDDAALQKLVPGKWRRGAPGFLRALQYGHPVPPHASPLPKGEGARSSTQSVSSAGSDVSSTANAGSLPLGERSGVRGTGFDDGNNHASDLRWPLLITAPLACLILTITALQFSAMFRLPLPWPRPIIAAYSWLSPFRSCSSYGLFAVMTTSRPEIIVEGSNDGVTWREYEFKYKPGDLKRRPRFVEPHQPRLDWQMWFAALSDYRHNLWFVHFCSRLLEGSPEVLTLLQRNPFPDAPPRYIRAIVYDYHFSDFATRRRTGEWWRREFRGNYIPAISLRQSG